MIFGRTNTAFLREDAFVVKTDSAGTIVWEKIIQFDSTRMAFTGAGLLTDGSSILIFREYNFAYQPTTHLVKLDPAGDSLWTKQLFAVDICCTAEPVIPLADGGLFQLSRPVSGAEAIDAISRIERLSSASK